MGVSAFFVKRREEENRRNTLVTASLLFRFHPSGRLEGSQLLPHLWEYENVAFDLLTLEIANAPLRGLLIFRVGVVHGSMPFRADGPHWMNSLYPLKHETSRHSFSLTSLLR